nr:hypothetical protein [Variovorax boronicumulans]
MSTAQPRYDEELTQLAAALRSMHIRAERARLADSEVRFQIKSELFEVSKRLHRLEEEALATDFELQKRGDLPEKKLILAAGVAKALDFSRSMIDSYLETNDKAFLTAASQASVIARSLLMQN